MGKKKTSFVFYEEWEEAFSMLTDEQRGKLMMALITYSKTGEVIPLSGNMAMALSFMRAQLDRDNAKYEERCTQNKLNAIKGGRPSKKADELSEVMREPREQADLTRPEQGSRQKKSSKKTERFLSLPAKPDDDNEDEDDDDDVDVYDKENDTGKMTPTPPYPPKQKRTLSNSKQDNAPTAFQLFWERYPRKVNKTATMRCWLALNPEEQLVEEILTAVTQQANLSQWKKENGRYIPYPANWLEERRWEDAFIMEQQEENSSFDPVKIARFIEEKQAGIEGLSG